MSDKLNGQTSVASATWEKRKDAGYDESVIIFSAHFLFQTQLSQLTQKVNPMQDLFNDGGDVGLSLQVMKNGGTQETEVLK